MNKFVRTISHPGSKFSKKKPSLGLCTWGIVVVHLYCGFSIRPDRAADSIAVQTSGWEWPTAGKSRCSNSLLLGQKSIHKYKPEHPRCFEVRWGTVPYLGLHLNRYLFLLYVYPLVVVPPTRDGVGRCVRRQLMRIILPLCSTLFCPLPLFTCTSILTLRTSR